MSLLVIWALAEAIYTSWRIRQVRLTVIIKDAVRIDKAEDSTAIMNAAFETMTSGRPGPVSVEMCWDTHGGELGR